MSRPQVLIVGGGISGLSTAWWLARQGVPVEVWEADAQPGGKIQSTREAGYLTERAAGLLVNFRSEVDQMIRETGLGSERQMRRDGLNRYLLHKDRLIAVPMRMPALLASPLWSLSAKLRLGAEFLIPKGSQPAETVSEFIRRRLGSEILDTAMDPFIAGTLASDPDKAEARSVIPRLKALEDRYGSLILGMLINAGLKRRRANKADTFSFSGGMSDLIQAMADTPGITLRCNTRVESLALQKEGWRVVAWDSLEGQRQINVPQLVLSTPADTAASLLNPVDERLGQLLGEIEYAPVVALHMGIKNCAINHSLDGTGFLVSRQNRVALNGNLWMSRIFPQRAPRGHTLLTSYLGGVRHPDQINQSDGQLTARVLHDLKPLLGLSGEIDYVRVDRHARGLPLYHGEYQASMERIDALLHALPGLNLTANYRHGVSVRERIFQGRQQALKIAAKLAVGSENFATDQPLALAR